MHFVYNNDRNYKHHKQFQITNFEFLKTTEGVLSVPLIIQNIVRRPMVQALQPSPMYTHWHLGLHASITSSFKAFITETDYYVLLNLHQTDCGKANDQEVEGHEIGRLFSEFV